MTKLDRALDSPAGRAVLQGLYSLIVGVVAALITVAIFGVPEPNEDHE